MSFLRRSLKKFNYQVHRTVSLLRHGRTTHLIARLTSVQVTKHPPQAGS
jgi:hypothetical protein